MLTHNPHYLIIGASSQTGQALIQYLSNAGKIYSISDSKTNFFHNLNLKQYLTQPVHIFDAEIQDNHQLDGIDHIIIAPGVPRSITILQEAQKRGIPVDSEIAFSLEILKQEHRYPLVLGITGSLGKSTTSFLLYQILKEGYKNGNTYLLGNFGTPLIKEIQNINKQDIIVLELSSYQLEDAQKYTVNGACILNVTPNHLDRYDSFLDYQKAKEKILLAQTSDDFAILNIDLPQAQRFKELIHSKMITVSSYFNPESVYSLDKDQNIYHYQQLFLRKEELLLKSPHMIENMLVALAFSSYLNIEVAVQKQVLKNFKGLEHRSEWVREINNIKLINDSKATTPFAIIPNLENPEYSNMLLILGGKNKNLDFSLLNHHLKYVKYIVYYGYSGPELQKMIAFKDTSYSQDFKDAILLAYQKAKELKLSTVLLSPGCTSFDQFESYEQRGHEFKKIVQELE